MAWKTNTLTKLCVLFLSICALSYVVPSQSREKGSVLPHQDTSLPIEQRVEDLVSRRTLEEEVLSESPEIGTLPPSETFLRDSLQDDVLDAMRLAERSFLRFVSVLVHGVHIGSDECDFRFRVHPAVSRGYQGLSDVANRLHHVSPLVLRKHGVSWSLQQPDILVMSDHNVEVS